MLKIQFSDNSHEPVWVVEKLFNIGRQPGNHLVIDHPSVEPVHARLLLENHKHYLKDNNSKSGCFVNGQRVTHKEIVAGDAITLGEVILHVLDPGAEASHADQTLQWKLIAENSLLPDKFFTIPAHRPVIAGRDSDCDIVIPGTHLSRRHVRLEMEGDRIRITDLSSANGTFVNEQPVTSCLASAGDRLRLDIYTFRLVAPDPDALNKARLRSTIQSLARPVERKQPDFTPKHWKTRPTSPGNRIEPVIKKKHKPRVMWAAVLLCLILAAAFSWL